MNYAKGVLEVFYNKDMDKSYFCFATDSYGKFLSHKKERRTENFPEIREKLKIED